MCESVSVMEVMISKIFFNCNSFLLKKLFRSHCACSYGHRNPGMEVFYQKSFEHSLAFSPQASNMVIIMETLARNHLKDDKDLVLVWLLSSITFFRTVYIIYIIAIYWTWSKWSKDWYLIIIDLYKFHSLYEKKEKSPDLISVLWQMISFFLIWNILYF